MAGADTDNADLERANEYLHDADGNLVGLEHVDAYVKRVKAKINLSRAQAANVVAYMLVGGFVLSLPLYACSVALMTAEHGDRVATVFTRWYDVIAPLVGAVIGGLFGMSIAGRQGGDKD
jgi:hypothetical protein